MRVVVVGAGIAGAAAASGLVAAGHEVVVVDKGRSPGGRMATRRVGAAALDHGAQFLTARSPAFRAEVAGWVADGRAAVWCHGFGAEPDGHPRHVGAGRGGMNGLCRSLLPAGAEVRTGVAAEAVRRAGGGWEVAGDGWAERADAVVLTPPGPQAQALLGPAVDLPAVGYEPCLAVLVALDGPPAVPPPGGRQLEDGPFTFVADAVAKGVSPAPGLTLHASPAASRERWDQPGAAALAALLAAAAPWLGGARPAAPPQLHRWRFARPTSSLDGGCLEAAPGLVLAGDAFHGAKVEGAWLSGRDAAAALA